MAATPTLDDLRKLSYEELSLLPKGLPEIRNTPDYQKALIEAQARYGVLPEFDPSTVADPDGVVSMAMGKLGLPVPEAITTSQVATARTDARSKVIIAAAGKPGARIPPEIANDKAAVAKAKKDAPAAGVSEASIINMTGLNAVPEWMSDAAGYSKKEKQKVVDTWNRLAPASQKVGTFEEFALANVDPSETAKAAITFAGLAVPERSHTFSLPGGGKYTVEQSELTHFFAGGSAFGHDKMTMVQDAINLASTLDIRNPGMDTLAWQPFMAFDRAGRGSPSPKDVLSAKPPRGPTSQTSHTVREADGSTTVAGGKGAPRKTGLTTSDYARAGALGAEVAGYYQLGAAYKKAFEETKNQTTAYLKVMNPELFSHVVKDGKIAPESIEYAIAAAQVLGEGGWDQMDDLGLFGQDQTIQDLTTYVDMSKAGGSIGASITLPDPLKVEQSMKDLYNAWFGLDPSSAEYGTFKDDLYAKLRGTLPGVGQRVHEDIDVGAQLRNFAETSANYTALFSAKPAGISADDYVNTNRQAVGSMIGSDLDPAAVRAGQLTGDTQTAIGAAAGSTKAKTNSTFQERLARAAQLVSANT